MFGIDKQSESGPQYATAALLSLKILNCVTF